MYILAKSHKSEKRVNLNKAWIIYENQKRLTSLSTIMKRTQNWPCVSDDDFREGVLSGYWSIKIFNEFSQKKKKKMAITLRCQKCFPPHNFKSWHRKSYLSSARALVLRCCKQNVIRITDLVLLFLTKESCRVLIFTKENHNKGFRFYKKWVL